MSEIKTNISAGPRASPIRANTTRQREVNNSCSCDLEEEKPLQSTPQGGLTSLVTGVVSSISPIVGAITALVSSISRAFSPLVSFIDSFDTKYKEINENNKKEAVKELTNVFRGIEGSIKNLNLSDESKKELEGLFKTVGDLNDPQNLEKIDIENLIKNWRNNRDFRCLLELARRIENGENVNISDERLRQSFVRALRAFGSAIQETQNSPQGQQALAVAQNGADATVCAVETVVENGGDQNLTSSQRESIGNNLRRAQQCAENLQNDLNLRRHVNQSLGMLGDFVSYVKEFIEEWFEDIEEAKEEEIKEEQEKKCEERDVQKEKIDKLCRKHKAIKRKANIFYSIMEEAKKKIMHFVCLQHMEKNSFNQNPGRIHNAENEEKRHSREYQYAKYNYRCEAESEDFYRGKEQEIQTTILPSSVCIEESVYKIDLDLLC